jgi:hypothetical protein
MNGAPEEVLTNCFREFAFYRREGPQFRVTSTDTRDAWVIRAAPESARAVLEALAIREASVPSGQKDAKGVSIAVWRAVTVDRAAQAIRGMKSEQDRYTFLCRDVDARGMERRVTQLAAFPGVQVARDR